jgi:NADPH-dependent 2,4-dienoyl-CoA reductase/sulfur reductase-like enzyme
MRVTKPGIAPGAEDTSVTFDGREIPARRGESLAAALIAAGHYAFRRTATTGERGVFCGMGVCSECALEVGGQAGRLACMEPVVPGLALGLNPPARRLARWSQPPAEPALPEEARETDVLVVGAGPAGLRAAVAAKRAGAHVLVVDERVNAGGQYFKQPAGSMNVDEPGLDAQYRAGRALLREAQESGIEILHGTRLWGHSGYQELYAVSKTARYILRHHALVLATGAFERGVPFPGWTLPGVMTTGAAQTLLRSYLVAPGARVLVAGNGPLNLQVAAELAAAGVRVVAVAEAAALFRASNAVHLARMTAAAPHYTREGLSYLAVLARARVPVLSPAAVVEVAGPGRAEVATVARLDAGGHPRPGTNRHYEVDAVCLGPGFVPSSELARSLGCEHLVDERTGVLVTRRDRNGRTSVDGVWVAGDGGGIAGAQVAQAMGTLAGLDAASHVRRPIGAELAERRRIAERELDRSQRFQQSLWRLYAAPKLVDQLATPGTVVCRCEEVTLAELTAAAAPWLAAAGSLKRATRAGMGKCQGRYCGPVLAVLAARQSGEPVGPYSGFAPQAPVVPVAAGMIAADPPPVLGGT